MENHDDTNNNYDVIGVAYDRDDVKQVLAMKYIVRRFVALFILAAVIAVPAVLGAMSYIRDMDDNHSKLGAETDALSYAQIEPYIRMYVDEQLNAEDSQTETGAENGKTDAGSAAKTGKNVSVGTVLMYAGDKTPKGFLRCDGRKVSREKYSALYAVIGDKYGAGDGKTTFNLPNMKTLLPVDASSDVYVGKSNASNADAEFAFKTAFKKVSEPTGPPPETAPNKGRTGDTETDGETAAEVATMYFIIKY